MGPRSTEATQFCTNYGVGACLRWPVDFDALDAVASTQQPPEQPEPSVDFDVLDIPTPAPSESPVPPARAAATEVTYGYETEVQATSDRIFRCAECRDAAEFGAVDEEDGLWYCKACWEALLNQPANSGDTAKTAPTVSCLLQWLQGALSAAIDDQCAVAGLMSWAEVLLTDNSTTEDSEDWESPVAQLKVLLHDEGVPSEVISQLATRWASPEL